MKIRNGLIALSLFILSVVAVSGQTRNISLFDGDSLTPASAFVDLTGSTTYYGGFINGRTPGGTFTFSVTFRAGELIDPTGGIYSGTVVAPNSSFAISEPT